MLCAYLGSMFLLRAQIVAEGERAGGRSIRNMESCSRTALMAVVLPPWALSGQPVEACSQSHGGISADLFETSPHRILGGSRV